MKETIRVKDLSGLNATKHRRGIDLLDIRIIIILFKFMKLMDSFRAKREVRSADETTFDVSLGHTMADQIKFICNQSAYLL